MIIKILPSEICGTLHAPASKSMMQRAIAAAFLSEKKVQIDGYTPSADVDTVLKLVQNLGTTIHKEGSSLIISPNPNPKTSHLNIGESGLGIRLFSPILALFDQKFTLEAVGSLRKRPIHLIEKVLMAIEVDCKTDDGFAPIHIQGPLQGGQISFDAGEGSQLLSGMLMALPKLKEDSELLVSNLKSKPYIDMTINLLNDFGIQIENQNYTQFKIVGNQKYNADNYVVEGDWSGATFLLVAAAINGSIQLENLRKDSLQGDKKIVDILKEVGAFIQLDENQIFVQKRKLNSFIFDATETPDLFPPLAVLATACQGISRIKGVHRLIHKESNRAEAIRTIFEELGLKIDFVEDEMIIEGRQASGGIVSSYNDHRMAMMAAVLALTSRQPIEIQEAESVEKSYPHFFKDLQSVGVQVNIQ